MEGDATDAARVRRAEGHAFEAFEWKDITVEGADWAMEMAVTPRVINSSGALQGGLMATLIDLVGGISLFRHDSTYVRSATSEMHINFLAGARVGPVRAVAHILRRGYRTAVVRVDVHDIGADNLFVATATLTFAVKTGDSADAAVATATATAATATT